MTDPANDLLVSAATVWEIAIKLGMAKLSLSMPSAVDEPGTGRPASVASSHHELFHHLRRIAVGT